MGLSGAGSLHLSLSLGLLVYALGSGIGFFRKRNQKIIKVRRPELVALSVGGHVLLALVLSFNHVVQWKTCDLSASLVVLGCAAHISATMMRCANLSYDSVIASKCMVYSALKAKKNPLAVTSQRNEVMWTRMIVFRTKAVLLVIVGTLSLAAIVRVVVYGDDDPFYSENCRSRFDNVWGFIVGMLALEMFLILEFLRRMRTIRENFFIRGELMLSLVLSLLIMIPAILLGYNFFSVSRNDFDIISIIFIIIPSYVLVTFSVLRVSAHAIEDLGRTSDELNSKKKDLSQEFLVVLKDDKGRELFRKFCEEEFLLENLLFFDEAQIFREDFVDESIPKQAMIQRATEIYEEYFKKSSPFQINVSSGVSNFVEDCMHNPEKMDNEMFYKAELEILEMIERDPYRRFKKKYFTQVMAILNEEDKSKIVESLDDIRMERDSKASLRESKASMRDSKPDLSSPESP